MNELIQDLELQIQDADKVIEILDKENKNLKEKVEASELNDKEFAEKMEEQFNGSLWKNGFNQVKQKIIQGILKTSMYLCVSECASYHLVSR